LNLETHRCYIETNNKRIRTRQLRKHRILLASRCHQGCLKSAAESTARRQRRQAPPRTTLAGAGTQKLQRLVDSDADVDDAAAAAAADAGDYEVSCDAAETLIRTGPEWRELLPPAPHTRHYQSAVHAAILSAPDVRSSRLPSTSPSPPGATPADHRPAAADPPPRRSRPRRSRMQTTRSRTTNDDDDDLLQQVHTACTAAATSRCLPRDRQRLLPGPITHRLDAAPSSTSSPLPLRNPRRRQKTTSNPGIPTQNLLLRRRLHCHSHHPHVGQTTHLHYNTSDYILTFFVKTSTNTIQFLIYN